MTYVWEVGEKSVDGTRKVKKYRKLTNREIVEILEMRNDNQGFVRYNGGKGERPKLEGKYRIINGELYVEI
ncbi:MAG TPA: hypothetical protein ENF95_00710 [Candidatus Aenigmarchaeota archaeon]|nr:hypothetical protein [Candidatus Aenigmarchaeota archaeon]